MEYPIATITHSILYENDKEIENSFKIRVGETEYSSGQIMVGLSKEELLFIRDLISEQLIKPCQTQKI